MDLNWQCKPWTRVHDGSKLFLVLLLAAGGSLVQAANKPGAPAAQNHPAAPARPAPQMRAPANHAARPSNAPQRPAAGGAARTGMGQGANASRPGAGAGTAQRPATGGAGRTTSTHGGTTPSTQHGTAGAPAAANHGSAGANNRNGPGNNAQSGAGRGGMQGQHAGPGGNHPSAGDRGQIRGGSDGRGMAALKTAKVTGGGTRTTFSNGGSLTKSAGGRPTEYHNPQSGVHGAFDHNGHLATVSRSGPNGSHMEIRHGPSNERRIETVRPVHGGVEHVVSYGHGRGYYERPIAGRPGYVQRTVVVGGRSYGVVYHQYIYHGVYLYRPIPAVVFAPAYYGWLMTPWPAPVYYAPSAWGWVGQPWYGYYGAAFAPYPVYSAPDLWLTDYLIAASLQQAYEDQQAAAAQAGAEAQAVAYAPPAPPQIGDDEKALIDQDVKAELARQQQAVASNAYAADSQAGAQPQEAAGQVPEALQDHLFTVFAAPVEAKVADGGACDLSEGDMLFRKGDAPNADNSVDVVVKTSHGDAAHPGLCSRQAAVRVQLADLQEMYNHKKELLAEGMQKQAGLMGKKHGTPKGPKAQPTEVATGQASPDAQAVAELKQQILDGDSSEAEVKAATNPSS